jgi:DNA helicase-2/ATP-dependent DNA helicase PcrA
MDYLSGLNDRQREAVLHTEGPLLILAGAGSGKTRVVTHKIAYLIEEKGIFPGNILAITFTNKAASEMKERVADLLGEHVEDMWMGTFHSICVRMLRRDIDKIGFNRSFTIYDRDDQITLMKECIKEKNLDKEVYKERSVLAAISSLKDTMTEPDTYINQNYKDYYKRNIGELYELYQEKLKQYNALDFDDLIIKTVLLLKTNPMVLDYYQKKFKYVFVDEYQDTNKVQYDLVKLLSGKHKNICVVGDGDQCIAGGMKVNTPNGEVDIEDLEKGSMVYSSGGCGKVMTGTIDAIMKKEYKGPIIYIKTESGKELKLTPNHIMFSKLNPEPGVFYVYLMYKKELGYRIGQTQGVRSYEKGEIKNGLAVRMNQENGDKSWILRVCNSKEEATYYELLYSTKYGIPTMIFHPRGRRVTLTQESINKFFNEIDTRSNVIKLMDDLLIFEEYPLIRQGAVIRKGVSRRIVNLTYFGGKVTGSDAGWHSHRINFNTSGDNLREKAINNEFNVRKGQRNTWRIETERKDYDEAYKLAAEIITLEEDIEINQRARLSKDATFNFMPASHIKPSMSIAVYNNNEITEEIVSEVKVEEYDGFVYDLSIPNLRQYVCQGIVVHNSIYGWRGADITNILNFEKDFQNSTTIILEQNYRSTQNILNVANKVIRNNSERKAKNLWTSNHEGDPISYDALLDSEDEALFAANKIEKLIDEGYKPSDMAILYRTNAQSRSFEEVFIRKNLPYKIVGGLKFYDRKEIKDIVAYLKLVQNPVDNISLKRIINVPKRGIGNATIEKIEEYALEKEESMYSVLLSLEDIPGLSARAKNSLNPFVDMMNRFMAMKEIMGIKEFIEEVIYSTGYIKELEKEDTIESQTRIENIKEFISVAVDFEVHSEESSLEEFLANITLLSDIDKTEDTNNVVTMMTVHSAKGLEFPVVFLVGMEEGLFPIARALDNESDLEEERRLCYVAITRAEKLLYITNAKIRTIYGNVNYTLPSRFIEEMGEVIVKEEKAKESFKEQLISVKDFTLKKDTREPRPFIVQQKPVVKKDINLDINIGDKVRHKKWGMGTIVQTKDREGDKELVIAFDKEGLKRLLLSIAPIEVVKGD